MSEFVCWFSYDIWAYIPAQNEGETRWMVIVYIDKQQWTAIVTFRGRSIRLIFVSAIAVIAYGMIGALH